MKKVMDMVKSKNFLYFLVALVVAGLAINHVGNRKNRIQSGYENKEQEQPAQEGGFPGASEGDLDDSLNPGDVNAPAPAMNTEEASDLLPNAVEDPAFNGANTFLNNKNLVSTFQIPMQSQSLRNANLQIRSEPPNPQTEVCAWNQSTIGPDQHRRNLEICNE